MTSTRHKKIDHSTSSLRPWQVTPYTFPAAGTTVHTFFYTRAALPPPSLLGGMYRTPAGVSTSGIRHQCAPVADFRPLLPVIAVLHRHYARAHHQPRSRESRKSAHTSTSRHTDRETEGPRGVSKSLQLPSPQG